MAYPMEPKTHRIHLFVRLKFALYKPKMGLKLSGSVTGLGAISNEPLEQFLLLESSLKWPN